MLSKEQIQKILVDLEELNTILDDEIITQKKDEVINKLDGMINLLEVALRDYEE
jgi:hypothetical protein